MKTPLTIEDIPEDLYNQIADRNWELGKVCLAEDIPKLLRQRSGEAYAADRTDEASILKRLAVEFEGQAEKMRATFKIKYPKGGKP